MGDYREENAYIPISTAGENENTYENFPHSFERTMQQESQEYASARTAGNTKSRPTSGDKPNVKNKQQPKMLKITRFSSTQLLSPITLDMMAQHNLTLSFLTDDKLVILFRYCEQYVVCRKSDCAIALLKKPVFKKSNPAIMFDGDQMGAILHNVQTVIMYAVAKEAFHDPKGGMQFSKFDLILVLGKCRGVYFGMTVENRVGVFPPDKVAFITKPRRCIFPGMILKVEAIADLDGLSQQHLSVRRFQVHTITKGKDNLFDWCTPYERRKVPLHVCKEYVITERRLSTPGHKTDTHGSPPPPLPPRRESIYDSAHLRRHNPDNIDKDGENETTYCQTDVTDENPVDDGSEIDENMYCEAAFSDTNAYVDYHFDDDSEINKVTKGQRSQDAADDEVVYEVSYNENSNMSEDMDGETTISHTDANDENPFDDGSEIEEDIGTPIPSLRKLPRGVNTPIPLPRTLPRSNPHVPSSFRDKARIDALHVEYDSNEPFYNTIQEDIPQQQAIQVEVKQYLTQLDVFCNDLVNDKLRKIVADWVDETMWDKFVQMIKVPNNRRKRIESQENTSMAEKTYELLCLWRERFGRDAKLGSLIGALVYVNPEELRFILKDILRELHNNDSAMGQNAEIPEEADRPEISFQVSDVPQDYPPTGIQARTMGQTAEIPEATDRTEQLTGVSKQELPGLENISKRLSRTRVSFEDSDVPQDYSPKESPDSTFFDKKPHNTERYYAVPEPNEKLMKESLLQQLLPYRDVVMNEQLRVLVAASVKHEVLHDLGEQIQVSKIRLRDIGHQSETINEKIYDLIGTWQVQFGSNATVGFLLDALVKVNPENLNLILRNIFRTLQDSNARYSSSYEEIPENSSLISKKPISERVQILMNILRSSPDVEMNDRVKEIVSQYINDEVWHELGRTLEISINLRKQIEANRTHIYDKTCDLLQQWHQMLGGQATLHLLLDALEVVNPDDLHIILRDLSMWLDTTCYEDVS